MEIPQMRLQNGEVQVDVFSAVWDSYNDQLVACGIAAPHKQQIKSILATLSVNSNRTLTLRTPHPQGGYYRSVYLKNTKKGFFHMSKSMTQTNAEGWVECIEHPANGDPRLLPDWDWFYVVTTEGQAFTKKFVDRLNLAIAWPVLPQWSEYLLEAGRYTKLVKALDIAGPGYEKGIMVYKDQSSWESLISAGMVGGSLSLN